MSCDLNVQYIISYEVYLTVQQTHISWHDESNDMDHIEASLSISLAGQALSISLDGTNKSR